VTHGNATSSVPGIPIRIIYWLGRGENNMHNVLTSKLRYRNKFPGGLLH